MTMMMTMIALLPVLVSVLVSVHFHVHVLVPLPDCVPVLVLVPPYYPSLGVIVIEH